MTIEVEEGERRRLFFHAKRLTWETKTLVIVGMLCRLSLKNHTAGEEDRTPQEGWP